MSAALYASLLKEARAELDAYMRLAKDGVPPQRSIDSLAFTHAKMIRKIDDALHEAERPVAWRNPEPGAWHSRIGGYELSVYKDAGAYYWQVNCTDASASKSLDAAQTELRKLVGVSN